MRLWFGGLLASISLSINIGALPVWAEFSAIQVGAFVEALRQAAPKTGHANDGLYSDWKVQPQNIPRWSKACLGRSLTPDQFAASPATARQVITCVVEDVLREQYRASGNNESLAVRRTAAWWMTGDPNRYATDPTSTYTQTVLNLYRHKNTTAIASTTPDQSTSSTARSPSAQNATTAYDRYMHAGYTATKGKDNQTALLYFKRALDERPDDSYATQAIRNVERYLSEAAAPASSNLTSQQAVELINRWLQSKAEIFAPPFNQQRIEDLATGELYASLVRPDGVLDWLKHNQAYYRYGVQTIDAVERFVASRDRATIEIKLTEERTLYWKGNIDPTRTDFSAQQIRYSLERVNGTWKIADYKTIEGLLLERSVLNATKSSDRQ